MKLIQIRGRIINLDNVTTIDLQQPVSQFGVYLSRETVAQGRNSGEPYELKDNAVAVTTLAGEVSEHGERWATTLYFEGDEAEALRSYFAGDHDVDGHLEPRVEVLYVRPAELRENARADVESVSPAL